MKIVVIGGTGLIGSRLVQKLRESGHAVAPPLNGVVEIAGPAPFRVDQLIRDLLTERNDPREVITDPQAGFFGITPSERALLPEDGARLGETRFGDWLRDAAVPAPRDDAQSVMDASHA